MLNPSATLAFTSAAVNTVKVTCCGGLHVFDLGTRPGTEIFAAVIDGSGFPNFDVESAIALPYAPFMVIGGQSDIGNNVNVTDFVDLTPKPGVSGPPKIDATHTLDIGSVQSCSRHSARSSERGAHEGPEARASRLRNQK